MISDKTIEEVFDWLQKHDPLIAQAKALVHVWDKGEKSKKSDLMRLCNETSSAAKETYAYSHEDYKAYTRKTAEMIEQYESLRLQRETKLALLEAYRTQESSRRAMVKGFA